MTTPATLDAAIRDAVAMPCLRPQFRGQRVVDRPGVYATPEHAGCCIVVEHNVLSLDELEAYRAAAERVERRSGPSAYGHAKPRREVCYHVAGDAPYAYSGQRHLAREYPAHVVALAERLRALVDARLADAQIAPAQFARLSHGVDIVYTREFERGGSIGAHSDDECADWGLVLIFSLGQTRWLRVRDRSGARAWTNVELRHNSLVAMHGADFQRAYTHQVDKLSAAEPVGTRHSLNVRYGPMLAPLE